MRAGDAIKWTPASCLPIWSSPLNTGVPAAPPRNCGLNSAASWLKGTSLTPPLKRTTVLLAKGTKVNRTTILPARDHAGLQVSKKTCPPTPQMF
ncbi:hypothetical protein E2C01_088596 [Portunus trituberculatus]|uniref:Uncharacterized protein n=1 Tax=Portunus trituberculatus TaxID=210409 RepID=A0A5B7JKB2_PORTR|nr:hypothetical protein [Portunus trituberculatus]